MCYLLELENVAFCEHVVGAKIQGDIKFYDMLKDLWKHFMVR